jgi:ABC-type antimicrobial peptide transport system permease subunit
MGPTLGTNIERQVTDRRAYYIYVFGRLAPGASIEQARAAINAVYQPIIREVEAPLQKSMRDSVMRRFLARQVTIEPGSRGQSSLHNDASAPLFMLFAITGLVLLIACANIANLLLARATNREMEMAVRLSLGATRRQLLAQLLTESLTLAVIGGVSSLLFAIWTLQGITTLLPTEFTSRRCTARAPISSPRCATIPARSPEDVRRADSARRSRRRRSRSRWRCS